MLVTANDFERLTVAGMNLLQDPAGHLWERQFGRFENTNYNDPSVGMRKQWQWGHWIEGGWAGVMLARQFLIDNGHDFEIFYDSSYPTEWVIFTDYHRE
jgi:hypothetical protein